VLYLTATCHKASYLVLRIGALLPMRCNVHEGVNALWLEVA